MLGIILLVYLLKAESWNLFLFTSSVSILSWNYFYLFICLKLNLGIYSWGMSISYVFSTFATHKHVQYSRSMSDSPSNILGKFEDYSVIYGRLSTGLGAFIRKRPPEKEVVGM